MRGPRVLAQTLSVATTRGSASRPWQYHSRSDNHSKVACWTVLFDMLIECDPFRRAAAEGRIGFGINHVMVGPINKTLDLVVTIVPPERAARRRDRFSGLVERYGVVLSDEDRSVLAGLPDMEMDERADVSEVAIALEAKACMTEHGKSLPRLHAEILATGYLAKRAAPRCIAVSYSLVNSAVAFLTPSGAEKTNVHSQPADTRKVLEMLGRAVPTRNESSAYGYDVVGATTLVCRNDGSPVEIVEFPPRSIGVEHIHYARMIRSLCAEYRGRFS